MTRILPTTKFNPNKHLFILMCLALAITLLPACSTPEEGAIGAKAPDFTLPSTDGGSVSMADYNGEKPVLLFFHMAVG